LVHCKGGVVLLQNVDRHTAKLRPLEPEARPFSMYRGWSK